MSCGVVGRKKRVNQAYLVAMMEMGIPKHKAEVALTETGNVGVEVATEWLFSTPDTAQFEQYTSDTGQGANNNTSSSGSSSMRGGAVCQFGPTLAKCSPLLAVTVPLVVSLVMRQQQQLVLCTCLMAFTGVASDTQGVAE
jgi:hypothetical protein